MRKGLVYLSVLVATCVTAVIGVRLMSNHTSVLDKYRQEEVAPPPEIFPAPGQAFVTGTVQHLSAVADQVPDMKAPFTLTAVVRGTGRATIDNAIVAGKRVTISWPGGTPLPINGTGGLLFGAGVRVDAEPTTITWTVDGAPRSFVPGSYRAAAPVAVGSQGIATPRDSAEFTADAQTVLQSSGGVVVKTPTEKITLRGPGRIVADGKLRVRYPATVRQAGKFEFGEGKFEVNLSRSGAALAIDAVLEGPIRSN